MATTKPNPLDELITLAREKLAAAVRVENEADDAELVNFDASRDHHLRCAHATAVYATNEAEHALNELLQLKTREHEVDA